jgi:uncharacterized protein YlxW (UPF0749 family)
MALLREVMDPPLDPGYASWADSREEAGLPRSTGGRTWLLLVTAVLLGFLLSVAAQTLRAPDPASAGARSELRERIEEIEQLGDERVAQIEALRAEVSALQEAKAEPEVDPGVAERAATSAGASALQGPGVILTLNDPPLSADSVDGERVLARDLQVIVNGLWANGAEAISINDLRLTSTSTIRFAGQAIVVDLKGLARPYEITVIGPPDQLMEELTAGDTGNYLEELRSDFRILVTVTQQDVVTVPAGTRLSTRVAEVLDDTTDEAKEDS